MRRPRLPLLLLLLVLLVALTAADQKTDAQRKGREWLAEREKEEGVVKTNSGLLYKVLATGTGTTHPRLSTRCRVHYRGTFPDGEEFDSSYRRGQPTTFAPNQVIKGWTEALQLMHAGDKWELYIPYELAYGVRGSPPSIPAYSPLQFEIELLDFEGSGLPKKNNKHSDDKKGEKREKHGKKDKKNKKDKKDKKHREEGKDHRNKIEKDLKGDTSDNQAEKIAKLQKDMDNFFSKHADKATSGEDEAVEAGREAKRRGKGKWEKRTEENEDKEDKPRKRSKRHRQDPDTLDDEL